jgi:hypothetical protein
MALAFPAKQAENDGPFSRFLLTRLMNITHELDIIASYAA